ncbi:MAG: hypothetical protein H0T42_22925 [Deltaproteobacteria bacterium]|nr:hypothetical protein [Deltaproteobacteria bacterium]
MTSLRSAVILVAVLSACSAKNEGDVDLRVINPPTCAPGHALAKQVVVRIESGENYVQQGLGTRMSAPNTWVGKRVKVKTATCPLDTSCQNLVWARTIETTVGGSDRQVSVEIPKVDVLCDDGTPAG